MEVDFQESASVGAPNRGLIVGAAEVPDRGEGFVRSRPGESTRSIDAAALEALQFAAAKVHRIFGPETILRVGDASAPRGGSHSRHGSHRSGRDVDLGFYLVDENGVPFMPHASHAFSRYGHGFEEGTLIRFDDARNWALVKALLENSYLPVQWIFVSRGLASRLIAYASIHENDRQLLVRAAAILHQPTRAAPHDDHFHIRFFCSASDRAMGCEDPIPHWWWERREHLERIEPVDPPLEVLLEELDRD